MKERQTTSTSPITLAMASMLFAVAIVACDRPAAKTSNDCRNNFGEDVKMAGRTAGQAAETGAVAAWEGTKTAGRSVGGLVRGGKDEAKREWDEGGEQTEARTAEQSSDVSREANVPRCPED